MLKKMSIRGIVAIGVVLLDLFFIIITEPALIFLNGGILREYEESLIEPLFFGSLVFLLSVGLFFFFTDALFKIWLKYIVSWYIPLAVFFISTIDINSSFILKISRTTAALYWAAGLFILTVIFALMQKYYYKVT